MTSFDVVDLGRMGYSEALAVQRQAVERIIEGTQRDTLYLVEHDHILTLGAGFHEENLLHSRDWYSERGFEIQTTDRGGDVTYHGPGQLVLYPIFDVSKRGKDLHRWMRDLEQTVLESLNLFGFPKPAFRSEINSGVWTDNGKLCAIGIKLRRWVSMHGIAINCDVDRSVFETFVPCGIKGHGVTSVSHELGRTITVKAWKEWAIKGFDVVFDA